MQNKTARFLVTLGVSLAVIAVLVLGYRYQQRHPEKFGRLVECRVDIVYANPFHVTLHNESTVRIFRHDDEAPEAKIDDILSNTAYGMNSNFQGMMGLPNESFNSQLFHIVSRGHVMNPTSCPDASMEAQALVYMKAQTPESDEPGTWSTVVSYRTDDGHEVLRTEKGQDYIEVFLTDTEMEHMLKRALGSEEGAGGIYITNIAHSADEVKGDGDSIVARFHWSSTESKQEVLQSLGSMLQLKQELNATQQEVALFTVTDTGTAWSSNAAYSGDRSYLHAKGLDAATNEASAVSGALYAR